MVVVRALKGMQYSRWNRCFNSHAGIMVVVRGALRGRRRHCFRFQFPCGNYGRCKTIYLSPLTTATACFNSHAGIMVVVRFIGEVGKEAVKTFQFPCGNYGRCKVIRPGLTKLFLDVSIPMRELWSL